MKNNIGTEWGVYNYNHHPSIEQKAGSLKEVTPSLSHLFCCSLDMHELMALLIVDEGSVD